jgi:hypothetical protein
MATTATTSSISHHLLQHALHLAEMGWAVFPLAAATKRPLANCRTCQTGSCDYDTCPCLRQGAWCHGVRAATTNPATITTWWTHKPTAVPATAAGPSGLVLIDLDTHTSQLPDNPATRLLPGHTLTDPALWNGPDRLRDGTGTLRLLARLAGGTTPWPTDPDRQPVTVASPSGGRHLWYRAPADGLRQALGEYGLGWQIDLKAGWSYGIAPGTTTPRGAYQILSGNLARPGQMPDWLAREVLRVATPKPTPPAPAPQARSGSGPAAYLITVIDNGAAELAILNDGRKAALSALAYKVGGLLHWANLTETDVTTQLTTAGTASGLPERTAHRIVTRALTNGLARPLPGPRSTH